MRNSRTRTTNADFLIKCILSLWVAFGVYAFLSIIAGDKGIFSYHKLMREKARLTENFEKIAAINHELDITSILLGGRESDSRQAIPADPGIIIVAARDIGYGVSGEHLIRVVGVEPKKVYPDHGEPVYAFRKKGTADYFLKIMAIFSGMGLFLCIALHDVLDFIKSPHRRYRRAKNF
jgi:hypothetical protein